MTQIRVKCEYPKKYDFIFPYKEVGNIFLCQRCCSPLLWGLTSTVCTLRTRSFQPWHLKEWRVTKGPGTNVAVYGPPTTLVCGLHALTNKLTGPCGTLTRFRDQPTVKTEVRHLICTTPRSTEGVGRGRGGRGGLRSHSCLSSSTAERREVLGEWHSQRPVLKSLKRRTREEEQGGWD